jgi:hypothetical protein
MAALQPGFLGDDFGHFLDQIRVPSAGLPDGSGKNGGSYGHMPVWGLFGQNQRNAQSGMGYYKFLNGIGGMGGLRRNALYRLHIRSHGLEHDVHVSAAHGGAPRVFRIHQLDPERAGPPRLEDRRHFATSKQAAPPYTPLSPSGRKRSEPRTTSRRMGSTALVSGSIRSSPKKGAH